MTPMHASCGPGEAIAITLAEGQGAWKNLLGVPHHDFETLLQKRKAEVGATLDTELEAEHLNALVGEFKALVRHASEVPFPERPMDQLRIGIEAVFRSWNVPRAVTYRKLHSISTTWGTAANVQSMLFGNMGAHSGTGVAFTRDPGTGEKRFFGEFLINAQDEDVVAGTRTPEPIDQLAHEMPAVYRQLVEIYQKLERHYKDVLDLEFTIQQGKLFMLQTRIGKRTAVAALRIAVEMVEEGLIDEKTAVLRVEPEQLEQLLHPMVDPSSKVQVIAKELPASPGIAVVCSVALQGPGDEADLAAPVPRCAAKSTRAYRPACRPAPPDPIRDGCPRAHP